MTKETLIKVNGLVCDSRILDVIQELCCKCNLALIIERSKSIDVFDDFIDRLTIQFIDLEGDIISIYSYDQNSNFERSDKNNNTRKP